MADIRAALNKVVDEAASVIARNSGEALMDNSEQLAAQRVGRDTGTYHSSFRLETTQFTAKVVNDAPHAGFIEQGTGAHPIEAKASEALGLDQPIVVNGRPVRALRRVNHPGTEPKWVLRDALRQTISEKFGR